MTDTHKFIDNALAECGQCGRHKPVCCDTGYRELPDGTVEHIERRRVEREMLAAFRVLDGDADVEVVLVEDLIEEM